MFVDKGTKHTLIAIAAVVFVVAAIFVGITVASGVQPPQTVVISESMQHGPNPEGYGSRLGIIDTGDMIILKSKDKVNIQSYVDGYNTGYTSFGSYGNVIIYNQGTTSDPIIHRAILWLDYNGDGTWSAPSLKDYPNNLWYCLVGATMSNDYESLSGTLYMLAFGSQTRIDLNVLASKTPESGFLTKGDNNPVFDQTTSIANYRLVTEEQIKSVAWIELPWIGSFKMIFNGQLSKLDEKVPNTIPCLAAAILLIIFILVGISFLFDQRYYKKYKKILSDDINAPTPQIPVETEIK